MAGAVQFSSVNKNDSFKRLTAQSTCSSSTTHSQGQGVQARFDESNSVHSNSSYSTASCSREGLKYAELAEIELACQQASNLGSIAEHSDHPDLAGVELNIKQDGEHQDAAQRGADRASRASGDNDPDPRSRLSDYYKMVNGPSKPSKVDCPLCPKTDIAPRNIHIIATGVQDNNGHRPALCGLGHLASNDFPGILQIWQGLMCQQFGKGSVRLIEMALVGQAQRLGARSARTRATLASSRNTDSPA